MVSGTEVLIIQELSIILIASLLLNRFANVKNLDPLIIIAIIAAWTVSINVVILLPLDVSVTLYEQCMSRTQEATVNSSVQTFLECGRPWNYIPKDRIVVFWRIFYWCAFVFSWIVLPFLQSYNNSAHFTTGGRLRTAVINNALYYLSLLFIFLVILFYVITSPKFKGITIWNLRSILTAAANTWGLIFLVLLAGNGLIALPRSWHESFDPRRTYFHLSKLNDEKTVNLAELSELVKEISEYAKRISPQHPTLHWRLKTIIKKLPVHYRNEINQSVLNQQGCLGRQDVSGPDVTRNELIALHKRTIKAVMTKNRVTALWQQKLDEAMLLEDIEFCQGSKSQLWRPKYSKKNFTGFPKFDYFWFCRWRNQIRRTALLLLCVASFLVIWSECTFFIQKFPISLFALALQILDNLKQYFLTEILCTLIVAYIAVCAYYTLFNIRFFNVFYIAKRHTDANSLLFISIMMCRVGASLSLNIISMLHLDKHVITEKGFEDETAFTQLMGHLDVLDGFKKAMYLYFPILVCFISFVTYKKFASRLANSIGFFQFFDS